MKIWWWVCFLGSLLNVAVEAQLLDPQTKARLLLGMEAARPGETVVAGLELEMAPKWHTYWRAPGESGAPTEIEWDLPPGITAGNIQWPVPEKHIAEELVTFVYYGKAVLLIPLTLAKDLPPGPVEIKASVSWLECEDTCLPRSAKVSGTLVVGSESKPSPSALLLAEAKSKLPEPAPGYPATARWEGAAKGDERIALVEWTNREKLGNPDFYPAEPFLGDSVRLAPEGDKARVRLKLKKGDEGWPTQISGLIVGKTSADEVRAFEVRLPLENGGAGAAVSVKPRSLWVMLGFAFVGGLILNIMPCVLPVIALKIFGFVNQSREEPGRVRTLGLIYGLGVLASFLVLAALVIGVQKAGQVASWGMQFQNPQFLIAMTALVTLVALNLFGLFEVNLGGGAMSAAGTLASKEGGTGAFFNGILATVLATPCTAPFLGIALGFAFTQPAPVTLLMFLTVGVGLAFPYVVLSWHPAWLRFLPKPGVWMQKFKVAMGFPMLATAVWLLSLTVLHFGAPGALWIGLFLVILALAAWIWGEFVQRSPRRNVLALVMSLALILGGYGYILEAKLQWRSPPEIAGQGVALKEGPDGIDWKRWSPEAVEAARSSGRAVFVDFTATWCLVCQVNKKTSIEIPRVREKIKQLNVLPLLGDFSRKNPEIAQELKKYQRAGVPLVLVFPAGRDELPIVLPEALTPETVLNALDKAAPKISQTSQVEK